MTTRPDPLELARSSAYVRLLVLAAIMGAPIAALAYFFLALVSHLQTWVFEDLPEGLGFTTPPVWWPILPLVVAGVLVALTIVYLPGRGGHSPADGFEAGGGPAPGEALPGIALAALAGLALGAVIGPEAPLIALGGGLAAYAVKRAKSDTPDQTLTVVAAAGSFAAISTLLGSPLVAAFLMMEAAGLGGALMGVVLLPGLLASGIGYLIFTGLDSLTGLGTFSLAIPDIAPLGRPTVAEFLLGDRDRPRGRACRLGDSVVCAHHQAACRASDSGADPVLGLVVAGLAIAYAEGPTTPPRTCSSLARSRLAHSWTPRVPTRRERWSCLFCARGSPTACR